MEKTTRIHIQDKPSEADFVTRLGTSSKSYKMRVFRQGKQLEARLSAKDTETIQKAIDEFFIPKGKPRQDAKGLVEDDPLRLTFEATDINRALPDIRKWKDFSDSLGKKQKTDADLQEAAQEMMQKIFAVFEGCEVVPSEADGEGKGKDKASSSEGDDSADDVLLVDDKKTAGASDPSGVPPLVDNDEDDDTRVQSAPTSPRADRHSVSDGEVDSDGSDDDDEDNLRTRSAPTSPLVGRRSEKKPKIDQDDDGYGQAKPASQSAPTSPVTSPRSQPPVSGDADESAATESDGAGLRPRNNDAGYRIEFTSFPGAAALGPFDPAALDGSHIEPPLQTFQADGQEKKELEESIRELKGQLVLVREDLARGAKERFELEGKLMQLSDEYGRLSRELDGANREKEGVKGQLAKLEGRLRSVLQDKAEVEKQLIVAKAAETALKDQVAAQQAEVAKLQAQLKRVQFEKEQTEMALADAKKQFATAVARQEEEFARQRATLEGELKEKSAHVEELQDRLEGKDRQAEGERLRLQGLFDGARGELARVQALYREAEEHAKLLNAKLGEQSLESAEKLRDAERRLQLAGAELEAQKARVKQLEGELAGQAARHEAERKELEAARDKLASEVANTKEEAEATAAIANELSTQLADEKEAHGHTREGAQQLESKLRQAEEELANKTRQHDEEKSALQGALRKAQDGEHAIRQQYEEANATVQRQTLELEQERNARALAEERASDLKKQKRELSAELDEQTERVKNLEGRLQKQIAQDNEEKQKLEEALKLATGELERTKAAAEDAKRAAEAELHKVQAEAQSKIEELEAQNARLADELKELQVRFEDEKQTSEFRAEAHDGTVDELIAEEVDMRLRNNHAVARAEELKKQVDNLTAEARELQEQIGKLRKANDEAEKTIGALSSAQEGLRKKVSKLKGRLRAAEGEHGALRDKLIEAEDQKERLQSRLEQQQGIFEAKHARHKEKRRQLTEAAEADRAKAAAENANLSARIAKVQEKKAWLRDQRNDLREENIRLYGTIDDQRREAKATEQRLIEGNAKLEKDLSEERATRKDLSERLAALRQQLHLAKTAEKSAEVKRLEGVVEDWGIVHDEQLNRNKVLEQRIGEREAEAEAANIRAEEAERELELTREERNQAVTLLSELAESRADNESKASLAEEAARKAFEEAEQLREMFMELIVAHPEIAREFGLEYAAQKGRLAKEQAAREAMAARELDESVTADLSSNDGRLNQAQIELLENLISFMKTHHGDELEALLYGNMGGVESEEAEASSSGESQWQMPPPSDREVFLDQYIAATDPRRSIPGWEEKVDRALAQRMAEVKGESDDAGRLSDISGEEPLSLDESLGDETRMEETLQRLERHVDGMIKRQERGFAAMDEYIRLRKEGDNPQSSSN